MPLFEYDCTACGERVEVLVRGAEEPTCPQCRGGSLVKVLSVPAAPIVGRGRSLPLAGGCDPGKPPCGPGCCRLEQ